MISLIAPPRSAPFSLTRPPPFRFLTLSLLYSTQISALQSMLTQEYGTASNIKSRVNRLSVLAAITSTQQRLKLYNKTPPNGLIIYCGTILTDEGKEKKVRFLVDAFSMTRARLTSFSFLRRSTSILSRSRCATSRELPTERRLTLSFLAADQHLALPLRQQVPHGSARRAPRVGRPLRLHRHGR